MEIDNNILIDELLRRVEECTEKAKAFEVLADRQLQHKNGGRWSILECLEHLNRYGDYYLPEIEKQIIANRGKKASLVFRSGVVGNYFANLMEVKEGKITKLKSPGDKNPDGSTLTVTTVRRFLKQQEQLVNLLNQSRNIDLTKVKTAISISRLIKLRLGDTLRFFTYHVERHVLQAERALAEQQVPATV